MVHVLKENFAWIFFFGFQTNICFLMYHLFWTPCVSTLNSYLQYKFVPICLNFECWRQRFSVFAPSTQRPNGTQINRRGLSTPVVGVWLKQTISWTPSNNLHCKTGRLCKLRPNWTNENTCCSSDLGTKSVCAFVASIGPRIGPWSEHLLALDF
jgi:hypothetical protein